MKLKELRLERNLSQSQVAQAIGTSQRNIGRWENEENEPAAIYIKALSQFFGVSADYLLGLEDDFGVRIEQCPDITIQERAIIEKFRALPSGSKALILKMLDIKETEETKKTNQNNS